MEGGRKFFVTLLGMGLVGALAVFGKTPNVSTGISAISAMVLAFCGANAAVSWAYARQDSSADSHAIAERRDPVIGYEPTP